MNIESLREAVTIICLENLGFKKIQICYSWIVERYREQLAKWISLESEKGSELLLEYKKDDKQARHHVTQLNPPVVRKSLP